MKDNGRREDVGAFERFTAAASACHLWQAYIRPGAVQVEDHAIFRGTSPSQTPLWHAWCQDVLAAPIRREVQEDGRIRFWGRVISEAEGRPRILRVVTLADGETVHNAFFDRNFREDER